ncbi:hypothetical protein [Virgibacillus sp. SK37]|uniref:hypothetical protein n=1 Tax=Virgibacillus sp. SK37 TaxID=403957 RepID=UPI00119E3702|nr:hypothetical protein [Virgibacillus sp. SK37]
MKKMKITIAMVIIVISMLLSACNNDNQEHGDNDNSNNDTENVNNSANPDHGNRDISNPDIIPSETDAKSRTTNLHGNTYNGIGQNIYSSIGSSGIHEGGVSSYFESILKGEGITGIKVFVIDDSIVLARNKAETTNHQYDNMQRNLLSGDEGMSGKGEPDGVNPKNDDHDNLSQAKAMVNELFNGNVKVLTVTNPDATTIIENIKDDIQGENYKSASDDLLQLLNMAK